MGCDVFVYLFSIILLDISVNDCSTCFRCSIVFNGIYIAPFKTYRLQSAWQKDKMDKRFTFNNITTAKHNSSVQASHIKKQLTWYFKNENADKKRMGLQLWLVLDWSLSHHDKVCIGSQCLIAHTHAWWWNLPQSNSNIFPFAFLKQLFSYAFQDRAGHLATTQHVAQNSQTPEVQIIKTLTVFHRRRSLRTACQSRDHMVIC